MRYKNIFSLPLLALFLAGCNTLGNWNDKNATLTGIAAKANCQSFASCHYALVRRFDGANARLLSSKTAPDDPIATQLPKIRFKPGRHTIELVYRCSADSAPEKASLYQMDFLPKQSYTTTFMHKGNTCFPVIKAPNGKKVTPLISYLAE